MSARCGDLAIVKPSVRQRAVDEAPARVVSQDCPEKLLEVAQPLFGWTSIGLKPVPNLP